MGIYGSGGVNVHRPTVVEKAGLALSSDASVHRVSLPFLFSNHTLSIVFSGV
jgi:hypothetical protein